MLDSGFTVITEGCPHRGDEVANLARFTPTFNLLLEPLDPSRFFSLPATSIHVLKLTPLFFLADPQDSTLLFFPSTDNGSSNLLDPDEDIGKAALRAPLRTLGPLIAASVAALDAKDEETSRLFVMRRWYPPW
ncbi:MAG: hypothetical protein IT305_12790 [Chloroflexi bacterium]|nr:hypothetical protein [Chloroflexota bacterium]